MIWILRFCIALFFIACPIQAMQENSECAVLQAHKFQFKSLGEKYSLNKAAISTSRSELRELLNQKRCRNMLNVADENSMYALHYAARINRVANIRELLRAGADLNMTNEVGFTPLHSAADGRSYKAVQVLINHGADLEAVDAVGRTVLHAVVLLKKSYGNYDGEHDEQEREEQKKKMHEKEDLLVGRMVSILLKAGVNRYARETNDLSALDYAAHNGYLTAVKLILNQDENKFTYDNIMHAIGIAKCNKQEEVVSFLCSFAFETWFLKNINPSSTKE